MATAATATTEVAGRLSSPKRNNAARLFGYDIFISFALGSPPRGTHSYASDLARQLRERDFTVYFSEDEAPPGAPLNSTLLRALHRSRTLVVIANRGMLEEPRWVRTEVEEFRSRHPDRPIIPISVDGALEDTALVVQTQQWLAYRDKIWLDESRESVEQGIANGGLVTRLALVPAGRSSNAKWRWVVGVVIAGLIVLTATATEFGCYARNQSREARREQGIAEKNATEAERQQGIAEKNAADAKRQQGIAEEETAAADAARQRSDHTAYSSLVNLAASEYESGNSRAAFASLIHALELPADKGNTGFEWSYQYRRLTDYEPLIHLEHSINAVALAPQDNRIAFSSVNPFEPERDNAVTVASASDAAIIRKFQAHTTGVSALAFSPDGTQLLTGGLNDGLVKLWNLENGQLVWAKTPGKLLRSSTRVHSVAFVPASDLVAVYIEPLNGPSNARTQTLIYFGRSVEFLDRRTGEPRGGLPVDARAFAASPSGALIAAAGEGRVQVFSTRPGLKPQTSIEIDDVATSLVFVDENTLVAAGQKVQVLDVKTGRLLRSMQNGRDVYVSAALVPQAFWSMDHAIVAAANADGSISAFDVENGALRGEMKAASGDLRMAIASNVSGMILFEDGGGWINRTWIESILKAPVAPGYDMALSPDNRTAVVFDSYSARQVAGSKKGAQVVDLKLGTVLLTKPPKDFFGDTIYLSAPGTEIIEVDSYSVRAAKLTEYLSNREPASIYSKTGSLLGVSDNRKLGLIVSGASNNDELVAELFELSTGKTIGRVPLGQGRRPLGAISPSGDSAIVVVPQESSAGRKDQRSIQEPHYRFVALDLRGQALRISDRGSLRSDGSIDKVIFFSGEDVLFEVSAAVGAHLHRSGDQWQELKWTATKTGYPLTLFARADSDGLAIGSVYGEFVVVERAGGQLRVKSLSGHQAPVTAAWVDFSAARAVTGDADGFLKFWDLDTGTELFSTRIDQLPVGHIALSEDRKSLLVSVFSEEARKTYLLRADVVAPQVQTGNGALNKSVLAAAFGDATPRPLATARIQLLRGDFSRGESLLRTAAKAGVVTASQVETELARARMARAFALMEPAGPLVAQARRLIFETKPPNTGRSIELLRSAETAFRGAAALSPTIQQPDHDVALLLGVALYLQGDYAEVVRILQEAIRLYPASADLYSNLGFSLLTLNRLNEAAQAFSKGMELNDREADTYGGFAIVRLWQGQTTEARQLAAKAIQRDSRYKDLTFLVDGALWRRSDAEAFLTLITPNPHP